MEEKNVNLEKNILVCSSPSKHPPNYDGSKHNNLFLISTLNIDYKQSESEVVRWLTSPTIAAGKLVEANISARADSYKPRCFQKF